MLHRDERQHCPCELADLTSPEAGGVDDMFRLDDALVGFDPPSAVARRRESEDPRLAVNFGTVAPSRNRKSVRGARGIEVSLHRVKNGAIESRCIDQRAQRADFLRRDKLALDPQDLVPGEIRAQRLPALGRGGDVEAAGKVQPNVLARKLLNLAVKLNRVGLEARDPGITVQRMKTTGGVPTGAGGEFLALTKRNLLAPQFRQVIEHAAAHDAA